MKSINDYTGQLTSKLLADNGAFFAFSQKQLEEKKKPGINYIDLGAGLICPEEKGINLINEFDAIIKNAIKQQVADFGAEKIIEYEYFNHETQITGDVQQVLDVLSTHSELFPQIFTKEIILKVCQDSYKEAVKNDWF
jgi:hypothetical protein